MEAYHFQIQQLLQLAKTKGIEDIANHLSASMKEHIIRKADAYSQSIFTFENTWDMEACRIPYTFHGGDWNIVHHEDEEWCFMLNRMEWCKDLVLASLITNKEAYAITCLDYLLDWIKSHKEMRPERSTRTLDTGIRIMSIFELLPYLFSIHQLKDEIAKAIIDHLLGQILYLKVQYVPKYRLSNWGSIQTCAIVAVLPYLVEDYERNEIYFWAMQELEAQLQIQIYEDGFQWEQSTMYHVEVLNALMKACVYTKMQGRNTPAIWETSLYHMIDTLAHQTMPNGEIEAFGDSDRVLAYDVFVKGALYFKEASWKRLGGNQIDIDSMYLLGSNAVSQYETMSCEMMMQKYYDGVDCGMYTSRSSWEKDANFTLFTNGSHGSGHGHCDQLHVSLSYQGYPFLIDSGRFTYREDHPMRTYLKSMEAHNSIVLDDQAMSLPKDSWSDQRFAIVQKPYVKHVKTMHYYEGSVHSKSPLQLWKRKLMVADCGIWMFVDEVFADGVHEISQYFHFDPKVNVKLQHQEIELTHQDVSLHMHCSNPVKRIQKECSLRYNERQNHNVLKVEAKMKHHKILITCFYDSTIQVMDLPVMQGKDGPFSKDIVEAKKFILNEHESYLFIVFHKEIYQGSKLCICDDVTFHARSVCIHKTAGSVAVWRLKG